MFCSEIEKFTLTIYCKPTADRKTLVEIMDSIKNSAPIFVNLRRLQKQDKAETEFRITSAKQTQY